MKNSPLPALWLIILIVGLPQLSETVYTPALPDIGRALQVRDSVMEYTLTIYLFSFALGTFLWGRLSDTYGRKPCLLMGLGIYLIGCIGCYYSTTIEMLMISRFIQGFGGSSGSVLGQAIGRDAFQGKNLSKAFATIGSALSLAPAIGPIVGGVIDQAFGWPFIFLALILCGIALILTLYVQLPETHHPLHRTIHPTGKIASQLLKDSRVISCGLLVAGCNGIFFSYYAEGSFYLIELLGLSPTQYGLSFIAIALAGVVGGLYARHLHKTLNSEQIIFRGLRIIFASTSSFVLLIFIHSYCPFPQHYLISIVILSTTVSCMGCIMVNSNALSMALVNYRHAIGTASSLYGLGYYTVISLFTLGMGYLHDGTLLPMPLYFTGISLFMGAVYWIGIKTKALA